MSDIFNMGSATQVEQQQTEKAQGVKSLEDHINSIHLQWNKEIQKLNDMLKTIPDTIELENIIFAKRQDVVDYYHTWLNRMAALNHKYNQRYAAEYNNIKMNAQIRYSTEAAVRMQIEANMADLIYERDLYNQHAEYVKETIDTLDGIRFAIKNRIELEKLMTGVEFK